MTENNGEKERGNTLKLHSDDNSREEAGARRRFEDLPPAAQRALKEAEERRKQAQQNAQEMEKELGGRDGPEPTRYGDWEKKGIVSDF